MAAAFVYSGQADEDPADTRAPRPVHMEKAGHAGQLTTRRFAGRVEAVSTVNLSFEVGGRLQKMPVQEGRLLPEGALVAALDPTDFELAVREARVQRDLARKELSRFEKLLKRGNVSQQAYDRAQADYRLADVALDRAARNLDYARIEAPFEALVTRRIVDNFSAVQPKQDIVRVQNVTELHVAIHVPEHLIHLAADPDAITAEAVFPFAPDRPFALSYHEHETEADAVTQTYKVTFSMPRPDDMTILPGMTASVQIHLDESTAPQTVDIPLSAVDTDTEGNPRVWVVTGPDNTVTPRAVELGDMRNGRVLVREGIDGGETIVSAGTRLLKEGMRVEPSNRFSGQAD